MILVSNTKPAENDLNSGKTRIYRRNLIVLFLLIGIFSVSQIVLHFRISESRIWPGWYTAVLDDRADLSEILETLSLSGVDDVVSSDDTSVEYMAIPDTDRVALKDIDSILLPGDPRRDEWIAGLPRLFHSSDGRELIYLPADRSIRAYQKLMNRDGIVFADSVSRGGALSVGLFLLASVLFTLIGRKSWKHRAFTVAGSLVWLPYLWMAPAAVIPLAALSYFLLVIPGRRRGLRSIGAYVLAAAAGMLLILGYAFPGSVAMASLALVGSLACTLLEFGLASDSAGRKETAKAVQASILGRNRRELRAESRKPASKGFFARRLEHNLFRPVSLTGSFIARDTMKAITHKPVPVSLLPILASVSALLLLGFFFTVQTFLPADSGFNLSLKVPAPSEIISSTIGVSALHELDGKRDVNSLPDLSTLVASKAYQQSFLYGSEQGLPMLEDVISIRQYRNIDGILSAVEQPVLVFDQLWFESTLEELREIGIARVLLSAGGTAGVSLVDPNRSVGSISSQKVHIASFYIVLFLSIILTVFTDQARIASRGVYISLSSVRRRAQAA